MSACLHGRPRACRPVARGPGRRSARQQQRLVTDIRREEAQLREAQAERGGRGVGTGMLYGRVVEHVDLSVEELQAILARLTGKGW